jgi:hypothetical protein
MIAHLHPYANKRRRLPLHGWTANKTRNKITYCAVQQVSPQQKNFAACLGASKAYDQFRGLFASASQRHRTHQKLQQYLGHVLVTDCDRV